MEIAVVIRLVLSVALVYFAYLETGVATTILLSLLVAHTEIASLLFKHLREEK